MSKEVNLASIRRKFKDQWVVVEVTKNDEFSVPVAGKVILYGNDKKKVYDEGFRILRQDPEKELFFFYTGEPVPEDMGVILAKI